MWPKYGVADATPATPLTPSLIIVICERSMLFQKRFSFLYFVLFWDNAQNLQKDQQKFDT